MRQAIATGQAQRQADLATYETRREVQATQDAQARQQRQAHHQREVLYDAKYLFRNVQLLDREESLDNLQASIEWLSAGVSVITGLGTAASAVLDGVNAGISAGRGRTKEAALHIAAIAPGVGEGMLVASVLMWVQGIDGIEAATLAGRGRTDAFTPTYRLPGTASNNSFASGTQVVIGEQPDGTPVTQSIEDLATGDLVLTRPSDDPHAQPTYQPVLAVSSRTVYALHEVTLTTDTGETEVLQTTQGHPFHIEGEGWLDAGELQLGDQISLADGTTATVTALQTLEVPDGITVYNLTVADGQTYFVADDDANTHAAAWVHNARIPRRLIGENQLGVFRDRVSKVITPTRRGNELQSLQRHEFINASAITRHIRDFNLPASTRGGNPIVALRGDIHQSAIQKAQRDANIWKVADVQELVRAKGLEGLMEANLKILKDLNILTGSALKEARKAGLQYIRSIS